MILALAVVAKSIKSVVAKRRDPALLETVPLYSGNG